MSCSENFYIKDKNYSNIKYKIPCRMCNLCRRTKRKQWKERAEYEFKNKIFGAFVTLTYEDEKLPIVKGNDGKLRATLKYRDIHKYIDRLRKYIKEHTELQNKMCNPKFTYIGVGEYGQNGQIFDRPHYHILFFGLDHEYNKKLILKEWKNGFIDSKPILKGGINYVLKYMDKQIMGKNGKWETYRRYGLEEPKQFQSKGFGAKLYYNNYENAVKNNGQIKKGNKYIQIPQYYKNKMHLWNENEIENTRNAIQRIKNYNITIEGNIITEKRKIQEEIEEAQTKINKIREKEASERQAKNGEKIITEITRRKHYDR